MWDFPDPMVVATPAFFALAAAEMIYVRLTGRGRFETRDAAVSLAMGLGSVVVGIGVTIFFVAFAGLLRPYRLFDIAWSWPAIGLCLVLDDLAYYCWHRSAHRMRWFWAEHVTHHSSQHYNLSTGFREPWGTFLTPWFVFKVPLVLLGFPLAMMGLVGSANLVYQFWLHTEAIGKLPRWFEAVFNTPSHHRVHHATNARYLDRNFAGIFIVWDRLLGTFVEETADDPPRYGLVTNIATFNPFKVAFHEFIGLASDIWAARSWRDVGAYLFAPPGWTPDGSRETSDSIRARWVRFAAQENAPVGAEAAAHD